MTAMTAPLRRTGVSGAAARAVRSRSRPGHPSARRLRRRLGGALREEPQGAGRLEDDRDDPAARHGQRRHRAQGGGEHGADDEGDLVEGGLEGEGRVDLLRLGQDDRPARAHERAHGAGEPAPEGREEDEEPQWRVPRRRDDEGDLGGDGAEDGGQHDAGLAVDVDEPGQRRGADRGRDDVGGGDGAGRRVVPVQALDGEDRRDAEHGHREARDEPGDREARRAGLGQDASVGRGHRVVRVLTQVWSGSGLRRRDRWKAAAPGRGTWGRGGPGWSAGPGSVSGWWRWPRCARA